MTSSIFSKDGSDYLKSYIPEPTINIKSNKQNTEPEPINNQPEIQDLNYDIINQGYKNLPLDILPSKNLFYPDNFRIYYRAMRVADVRNFSLIDVDDNIDVDNKINMVFENTLKIYHNNIEQSYKSILDIDRLTIALLIRDISFINKKEMQLTHICNNCNNKNTIPVESSRLYVLKKNTFSKYINNYSNQNKCFIVGNDIKIYLPNIGNVLFLKHINNKELSKKYRELLYLFNPTELVNEEILKNKHIEINNNWTADQYVEFNNFINDISFKYKIELLYLCSCGSEVAAPFVFQRGIKELFIPIISNID